MTAENKHKCLFFGEYEGVPLNKVPLGYLARIYASFEAPLWRPPRNTPSKTGFIAGG
jgi:hypothetical protein